MLSRSLLLSASAFTAVTASPLLNGKRQSSIPSNVPSYVVEYAPIVYLFSNELYFPSDIGAQLTNTHPDINLTAIPNSPSPLTLDNLSQLNSVAGSNGGRDIYLTSNLNPTTNPRPSYLYGVRPTADGSTGTAISSAIVTVENKTAGHLDAFYFYFYAFNDGGYYILNQLNIGNHIGDWEHNTIRFNTSASPPVPISIWYSQHSGGEAFTYAATQKDSVHSKRPVAYSANGTHANYATPGTHDHTIPGLNLPVGFVVDYTDSRGAHWDPTLAAYYYSYDAGSGAFTPYAQGTPTDWLAFNGRWGDAEYPKGDARQKCVFGVACQWTGGPTGPADKGLVRTNVCPNGKDCNVLPILLPRDA